ncbi:GDP-mannose 4,6-dehydratase [Arthrobacter sp. NicSoilC5]|uniref:GDP-mannose 4,6-dehydratase n=1 Tax=Arthrobacter sp. NicSoilC5 TaxID=2831000 RepID=UPI001CC51495|nr:GDP-mannose 4,6-dehydratase [Arthrobacter sp. NicSoilC5]
MRTAFITGVGGQDGSYLAEQLLDLGWSVHALTRNDQAAAAQLPMGVSSHPGDLTDHESLQGALELALPDVVFNLAGSSSVARSWEDPAETVSVNSTAVAALLEATWRLRETTGNDIRFVQASSAEIFGNATEIPQHENCIICPVSPYGASKALAHNLVQIYRNRGMFAASAILYNHESPRRPVTFVTRKITSQVARIALGRADSLLLGNLEARRDWGWAPDYVDAMYRIATYSDAQDFVIATGQSHTVADFVSSAFGAVGISDWQQYVEIDQRFVRPADANEMRGDSSKAQRLLGWKPTVAFDEMVARMVRNDIILEKRSLSTPAYQEPEV